MVKLKIVPPEEFEGLILMTFQEVSIDQLENETNTHIHILSDTIHAYMVVSIYS